MRRKRAAIIVICTAMLLGVALIGWSSQEKKDDDAKTAGVKHTIEFRDTTGDGGTTDELMDMMTRSPQLVHAASEEKYELQIVSSGVGTAVYTFETAEAAVDLSSFQIIVPVQYVEEKADEKVTVPLSDSSELITVEVSDSIEKFPNADRGVLVEFTSADVESVPCNLVLVSGGEVYDNCSVTYKFDNETGDFTGGQLIYFGITMEGLSADAYLETSSMFNRYVLSDFSLAG